jgi:hypothetical protein
VVGSKHPQSTSTNGGSWHQKAQPNT